MKTINYENRFKAAFDLLFRPTRFSSNLKRQQLRLINETKKNIESDFENRVTFLLNQKERALLVSDFPDELYLFEVPLRNDLLNPNFATTQNARFYKKDVLTVSFTDTSRSVEFYKEKASEFLADALVNRDFIKSRKNGSTIEFFINTL